MIKYIINILLLLSSITAFSQDSYFKLASMMNGKHQLESGNKIDVWGYGWDTLSPYIEIPAPLLEISEGDSVTIRFRNISPEAHTIHLHGLDVSQVNDGVPSTSFYVWDGDTANYSFNADYSGTYLYHCHVTTTLHLTMGMYGMIVVNRDDSLLFDNGPKYDNQYYYLTSDSDTNLSPISPPPFNEITPNYFMVNGKRGSMLDNDTVKVKDNEKIALRLANVAYAKVKYIFPEEVSATVYMSDGRPLPNSFITDTLELYSGERYTVILENLLDYNYNDFISIEYFNTVKNELKFSNQIPLHLSKNDLSIKNLNSLNSIYPNPFKKNITISNGLLGKYRLFNSNLKEVQSWVILENRTTILINDNLSKGMYFLVTPSGKSLKLIKD